MIANNSVTQKSQKFQPEMCPFWVQQLNRIYVMQVEPWVPTQLITYLADLPTAINQFLILNGYLASCAGLLMTAYFIIKSPFVIVNKMLTFVINMILVSTILFLWLHYFGIEADEVQQFG